MPSQTFNISHADFLRNYEEISPDVYQHKSNHRKVSIIMEFNEYMVLVTVC